MAVPILHLRVARTRPSKSEETKKSCRIACATSPLLVGRDHYLRRESFYQGRSQRWIGPRRPKFVSMCQQALALAVVWKTGRNHLKFRVRCRCKIVQDDNQRFGNQRLDQVPQTRHSGANIDRVRVFSTLRGIETRRWSHLSPLRNRVETLVLRAVVLLTKRWPIQRLT